MSQQPHTNTNKQDQPSRLARSLLMAVCSVLLLVLMVLFTQPGNAFIWRQLTHFLPALSGELTGGTVLTGWRIKNLQWHDPQFSFQAKTLAFGWQPEQLFFQSLPITLFEIQQATLKIAPSNATALKTTDKTTLNTTKPVTMPIDVWVQQVNIQNLTVISDTVEVSVGAFKGRAQLVNNEIFIPEALTSNLQIVHKPATSNDKLQTQLPEIALPIPIHLQKFVLTNASFEQGEMVEPLARLELSFDWQSTQINNLQVNAQQARADVQASGSIELSGNYPLALNLTGVLHEDFNRPELAAIKGEQFSLQAHGDLQQLQLQLDTQGVVNGSLAGRVSALTAQFNLQATWPRLQWPLQAAAPEYSMGAGTLEVAGNLNNFRLGLDTVVSPRNLPASQLSLQSTGSLTRLDINELTLGPANSPEKPVKLSGQLSWHQGIHWQGKLLLSQLQPQYWFPNVAGLLNGTVNTTFSLQKENWQLSLSKLAVTGSLFNKTVAANGRVDLASSPHSLFSGEVHQLTASLGDNHVSVSGKIGPQLALQASVAANALEGLSADLEGSIMATAKLGGTHEAPELSFAIESPSFYYQDLSIKALKASGEFTRFAILAGKATINIGALNQGELELNNVALQLSGDEKNHQLRLQSQGNPLSATALLNGQWRSGTNSLGVWQGQLTSGQITTPVDQWALEQPLTLRISAQELALSKQCWLSAAAQLCINASTVSAMQGSTHFSLTNFNLSNITPMLPANLKWQGLLFGSGEIQWQDQQPTVHLKVHTTPGTLSNNAEALSTPLSYEALSAVVNIANDNLQAQFDLQSAQFGDAHLELAVNNLSTNRTLQGQIAIPTMHLNPLQPLLPELQNIHGTLSADARMGGTLETPLLFGTVKLSNGEVLAELDKVDIKNLNAELQVHGNKGELSGNMAWGKGDLQLTGQLEWHQLPLRGVIKAKGKNLSIRLPGLLELKASPDLTLTLGETESLSGKILIPQARVKIKQLPKQAIASSADVVIIQRGNRQTTTSTGPQLAIKVDVVLGNDITIDAYGLKSQLSGQLMLDQQPNKSMAANGSIQLINGRYHQFGQDLLIKEGRIIFSGPLTSPYLSVNAVRNPETIESDVVVGINVSGSPTKPNFSIYSDPNMAQEEQWSYLLRGHPLDGGDSSAVEAMLVGFGVSQFGGVVSSIGEKIGFSDVTIDTRGSGDDTQVTIGGNLSSKLRLQYGAGIFNAISEVKVRYELMPRLYVQAISGVARAVDLFYQFRVDLNAKQ